MKTLISKVFQWGLDRDLYKHSSVPVQLCKFTEEFFEYRNAMSKKESDDAVGDMLVVALNMYGVENYKEGITANDLTEKFYESFLSILDEREEVDVSLVDDYPEIHNKIIRKKDDSLSLIVLLCEYFGENTLAKCLAGSYDVIKDRKGKLTPEGNFVKEEDL